MFGLIYTTKMSNNCGGLHYEKLRYVTFFRNE